MPAPAMSSRHLYTGHRRGHIQAAPRLRAHRSEPLSRDHPQIPVSMPSLFRFDASAVVHTCSSSHRTPAPLTARRQPQRSPPRLLTDAACGGLESPPARRPRRNLPPSLAQHGSCRRSSTSSSSLPFRTHMGAGNSAVVVDLPRWGPMLSPRVPNLVPIPGPRMERETPGQRPRPNYGHPHAERIDPARERLAVLRQPRQQPCGPAPVSGRAVGADRRGHHRSRAAVRAGLRRSERPRGGQHRGASKTNGTEQDLSGGRPHLSLIQVGTLGRDIGGVVQKHLLQRRLSRRRSRRPPLMAVFSGPGALRSYACAPAAAVWTWHRMPLPSLGSGPASAHDREPAGRPFLARSPPSSGPCGGGRLRGRLQGFPSNAAELRQRPQARDSRTRWRARRRARDRPLQPSASMFSSSSWRRGVYRRVRQHMMMRPPRAAPADP